MVDELLRTGWADTDGSSQAAFDLDLTGTGVDGVLVTATATDPAGNTSDGPAAAASSWEGQLRAPDDTVLFESVLADPQLILPQAGTYTPTLSGNDLDGTGTNALALGRAPVPVTSSTCRC